MEAAAGARMRPGLPQSRRRCCLPKRSPPTFVTLARGPLRQLHIAAGPGPGPSGATSGAPGDAIIFRFTESATSPAVSTSASAGGGTPPGQPWSSLPPGLGGLAPPAALASSASVDAPTRATSGASTNSVGSPAIAGADGTSPTTAGPDTSSYSDFYRKVNQRADSPSENAANSWSHAATASSSGAGPSTTTNGTASVSDSTSSNSGFSVPDGEPSSPSPSSSSSPSSAAASATASASEGAEVTAAIARAQAALERAETSLDDIQRFSSSLEAAALASIARSTAPPSRWERLLSLARGAAVLGSLSFAMLASHAFGLGLQWVGAIAGAAGIAGWGLRRGSLAPSGAVAAFVVGCGTLGSSLRLGATLVAFFLSSSKLTAYKEELKEGLDENAKKGGQRTWVQVLCNGLVPTILAVVYGILAGCVDLPLGPPAAAAAATLTSAAATTLTTAATALSGPALEPWRAAALTGLMGGFLGYYSCCCGDTWASELGPLSADTPRLITSMRPVRRGTNGGVTLLGLSASIMGGMFMGLVFYLAGLVSPTLWIFESQRVLAAGQWRLIPLGLMAGLLGSVLDSVLGATLQFSGYDTAVGRIVGRPGPGVVRIAGPEAGGLLDNNAVNAVSASLTAALTAFVALKTFGF